MTGSDQQNQSKISTVNDEQAASGTVEGGGSQEKPLNQAKNEETSSREAGTCKEDLASGKELHKLGVDVDDPDLSLDNSQETPAYDAIGIHGLNGQSRSTWMAQGLDLQDKTWLIKDLNHNSHQGRAILYGYDTSDSSGTCFTLRGVYNEAKILLESLFQLRTPEIQIERRPIYFLSHDVGGLIAKAALILASREERKYADIIQSTRALVFFGYPHRPLTSADLEEQVIRLLSLKRDYYQQGHIVRLSKSLAETIIDVNGAFIHTKMDMRAKLINVYSTQEDLPTRVFDRFTSTVGNSFEIRLGVDKPHLELAFHSDSESDLVCRSVNPDWLAGEFSDDEFNQIDQMFKRASPVYPSLVGQAFFGPELEELALMKTNRVLHIQCPSDARLVTEKVYNYLEGNRLPSQKLLSFCFAAHERRFSTMTKMLRTITSQFLANHISSMRQVLKDIISSKYGAEQETLESLFDDWEMVRHRNPQMADSVHLIGCLDECDDTALWFLSKIRQHLMRSEFSMKIVIVTTKGMPRDKLIVDTLSTFPADLIARMDYSLPARVPIEVGFEVSMLVQETHQHDTGELQEALTILLSQNAHDQDLCLLLIGWLKSHRMPLSAATRFVAFPKESGPEITFEAILAEMPNEHQLWAQKLISWMLSSFRPLRAFEFRYLSGLCLDPQEVAHKHAHQHGLSARRSLDGILPHFGGLLTIVHDEIHFSHPAIRNWLSSKSEPSGLWCQAKPESGRHLDIVQTCLAHLGDNTGPADVWAARFPYATEFWTEHYKLTESKESLNVLQTVFEHPPTLQRWIDAYARLPTPFAKPLESSRGPLPLAAHFGLDDIVDYLCVSKPKYKEALGQALIESARGSQLPALRIILRSYASGMDFDNPHLHEAVVAASLHGDHEVFSELVSVIKEPIDDAPSQQQDPEEKLQSAASDENEPERPCGNADIFDDPAAADGEPSKENRVSPSPKDADEHDPNLPEENTSANWLAVALDRASTLGLDSVIDKLLTLVVNHDSMENMYVGQARPLHRAAFHSHLSAAEKLLAADTHMDRKAGERGETPIHRAAVAGASEVLKLLLDHGAAFEAPSNGWLPLDVASAWGHFAATEVLVQHKNPKHYSTPEPAHDPLYLAVSYGFYKTAKVLLCHEADPNACGPPDETVLMAAIRSDRIDLCRLLLEHGSDPDSTPEKAKSPLIQAVRFMNLDMVKLLVEKGADIEKREVPGAGWNRTPLHLGVFVESAEIVKYFLSMNADPHVSDEDGWSTLWAAARYGCEEIVRMLIEANADINQSCTESNTAPLHEAVEYPQVVKILLEHGANINSQAAGGETPLSRAIAGNHLETVKIMLADSRNRADLSLNDVHKALAYAVSSNYVEMVSEVLEAGADVNFADEDSQPLICLAIELENQTMLRAILEYSPDLSNTDTKGNTVLHYINSQTPVGSARLAVNAGASLTALNRFYSPPLDEAIASSCKEEVVRYLLSKDAAHAALTSSLSEDARGPIHTACKGSSLPVVQLLLEKGADINLASAGPFGTPLIAATLRNNRADLESAAKVIDYLLDKGADPSLGAGLFTYPIISACLAGSPQIVKRFLDCDLPVNVKDTLDRTPAHLACYNSLEVLNLLEIPASDFACVDKVGRVPLHYAVLSGQPDVVEAALARSKQADVDIDVQDSDGWTPLLWAARASMVWRWDDRETAKHDEVVSLLLREGARTDIHGRGSDKPWSVSDVAFYHQADSIADLFRAPDSSSERRPNMVKKGRPTDDWYCDCCLVKIWGVYFVCSTCTDFGLCFKCHMSKSSVHPQHEFADEGFEWDEDIGDAVSEASVREPPGSVDGGEPPEEKIEALDDRFDDEIVGDD